MEWIFYFTKVSFILTFTTVLVTGSSSNDILGCGGFVKSHVKLDFSEIEIGLYTKEGSLKEKTECAPTNGYYFLPLYEKGEYILKVHPPAGLSFEPSEVALSVDGVTDKCSTGQDINFAFNGFGINGRVVTLGQQQGPSGIAVQLVNEKGETRNTVTTVGGDFHFTAVIPGKYTVKASHPRWKLEPSQAEVQMKEGKMALGVVLTVKGYDVAGSVTSFGSPIEGLYVLLYSKEEKQKYRVEGCNTALLQGVPDSPICHVSTDTRGEFSFGLVPAGDYRLAVLPSTPARPDLGYSVRPAAVPFSVAHDTLYIKNAFEVIGFTVVGSVVSAPGTGLPGARVLLDGTPVATSDAAGKFTLAGLQPGVYTISFQHERCEIEEVSLPVEASGPRVRAAARAARWRVCGAVSPPAPRALALRPASGAAFTVTAGDDGKWCTFLPPGVYTAKVEVSDQEQREGLQYYPVTQKVSVGNAAVEGVTFSQLKGRVSGRVQCLQPGACRRLRITLRPLAPDGGYRGAEVHTAALDGRYVFEEVTPGSVEVSAAADRLCWAEPRHNVAVSQPDTLVSPFLHTGYVITLHATHDLEVEYKSESSTGVLSVPRGTSVSCVPAAERYTLTARGCHRFEPAYLVVDTAAAEPATGHFVAVAHAVGVKVTSPEAVDDLVLTIHEEGRGKETVGPLNYTQDGGMFVYQHTMYMADGAVAAVSASSASLLFEPAAAQVRGGAECRADALVLRARRALTLAGRLLPPVEGATLTLAGGSVTQTQVTSRDGRYRFGPLDAAHTYTVTAEKESYTFSEPDENGDIHAHKLAEIIVHLLDDADGKPLEGALVSVSGGSYRRSASAAGGSLRLGGLAPGDYYVKPNMKEYRFTPPHKLLAVHEGRTHNLTLRGVRVAWSCTGSLVSLGGQGRAGAAVGAAPLARRGLCSAEEALTDRTGAFRIRGLLPNCEYSLYLKESTDPELAGLKLVRTPGILKIPAEGGDISGVRAVCAGGAARTDAAARVRAPAPLYRTLRLALAPAAAPASPLYSARLDAAGYTDTNNPGLMYVLPRLPADNKTYVVTLESSLSRATHSYPEMSHLFISDGHFKFIHFHFDPKVKSSEQELRQSSFLLIPLLGVLGVVYSQRARLAAAWPRVRMPRPARPAAAAAARPDLLDKASIHQILTTVNAAGKKQHKKKTL